MVELLCEKFSYIPQRHELHVTVTYVLKLWINDLTYGCGFSCKQRKDNHQIETPKMVNFLPSNNCNLKSAVELTLNWPYGDVSINLPHSR